MPAAEGVSQDAERQDDGCQAQSWGGRRINHTYESVNQAEAAGFQQQGCFAEGQPQEVPPAGGMSEPGAQAPQDEQQR